VLALDDVALAHIPEPAATMFAAAMPTAPAITLRQLLQHTGGVFDFGTAAPYRDAIGADPHRVWSATDLLAVAFDHGTPYGPPGEAFHYSDTGYVLLALVLEAHTGLPFAAALRSLVGIDTLGLSHTWLEGKETPPVGAPARVHQYMAATDTFDWDPSFDGYGGGGLASTSRDLAVFIRSLVRGELLLEELTTEMLRCDAETNFGEMGQWSGLGIFASTIDGSRRFGHEGFWGVWMYHYPEHDITVTGVHTDFVFDPAAKSQLLHGAVRLLAGGMP
jgi:D-alanyl-D-alanine carboxypeptidase